MYARVAHPLLLVQAGSNHAPSGAGN